MNLKFYITFIICVFCISCKMVEHLVLIDQKDDFFWVSENYEDEYQLYIDSAKGIWFNGHIIINKLDTFYLRGFDKAGDHFTTVERSNSKDSIPVMLGIFDIWAPSRSGDTIEIRNHEKKIAPFPELIELIKKEKKPVVNIK